MTSDDREAAERDRIRRFYRERRNRRWSASGYIVSERQALLRRAAVEFGSLDLDAARMLDVGCGVGSDLEFWRDQGVGENRLFGTEIQPERAAAAADSLPGARIVSVEGFALPFATGGFHLTSASMVLSSIIDDASRRHLFAEMLRVTAPGGVVAVYDFSVRKPWNHAVVAMTRRRASALDRPPDVEWAAAPFLPLLPGALRFPPPLRRLALRFLPRTHVLYLWHL